MNSSELFLSGRCPYCGTTLDYAEGRDAVVCHGCDRAVPTTALLLDVPAADGAMCEEDRLLLENVTTVSAGLIYFDNFCESFDWAEFLEGTSLFVPRFNAIAEAYKLKYGTNPFTYVLDFRRIVVPVVKRIEALKKYEKETLAKEPSDVSVLFAYFDRYNAVAESLVKEKKNMFRTLSQDVKLVHKYGGDEDIVQSLLKSYDDFCKAVNQIKPLGDIKSSTIYARFMSDKNRKCAEALAKNGINAEGTYKKALELIKSDDLDSAMHLLLAVRGYMDSEELLESYTKCFAFGGELVELGGKTFYLCDAENTFFDVEDPTSYKKCKCKNLYLIEDGVPALEPTIKGVTRVISCFGSRIYYIKNDAALCVYNTKPSDKYVAERTLMRAPAGDWEADDGFHAIRFSADHSRFFIRKKLRDPKVSKKKGCFLFRKPDPIMPDRRNNYSVVVVDMHRGTCVTALSEVIDVLDFFGDNLFYTYTSREAVETVFRAYNIMTGADEEILHENCVIHSVTEGKILYSLYAPNEYNMDLYVFDTAAKKSKRIERNIFTYYTTAGSKIFYTIGNKESNRLYACDLNTRIKTEVLKNIGNIALVNEHWLYYIKGNDRNAVLMRVSTDGTSSCRVASRVAKFVSMSNGFIYYVNSHDELHLVRGDGQGDVTIARQVSSDSIIMDDKNIFYLRREFVGNAATDSEDQMSYSLYSTDLAGNRLRKLAFNVLDIKEYDENYIYIRTKEDVNFSITVPISKDEDETTIEEFQLTDYSRVDKKTGKIEPMMTLGAPRPENRTFRVGCWPFRRNKVFEGAVVKNLKPRTYVRPGATIAGTVYREEMEKRMLEEQNNPKKK